MSLDHLYAKYYRYGVTRNTTHLPECSSVVKQIAYAQYIDNEKSNLPQKVKKHVKSNNIYNAFIMPANLGNLKKIEYIGFSSADYVFACNKEVEPSKPYYKIHGILLDIRSLMQQHSKNNDLISAIENCILNL